MNFVEKQMRLLNIFIANASNKMNAENEGALQAILLAFYIGILYWIYHVMHYKFLNIFFATFMMFV